MKYLKRIKIAVLLSVLYNIAQAQQNPMFTHYMYNTLSINPAYAGSREALTITALHRTQWLDFKGAPLTQTLTLHTPLRNEHLGLGLSIVNDKIGPTNNTGLYADFAYIMQLNEKSKLALGIKAGGNLHQGKLTSVGLDQQADPSFQTNISNKFTPNVGFGAYYYRERFYAGVSTPGLIQNDISTVTINNGNTLIAKEQRHYYLIAGAVFNISENLAFKPTTLIKVTTAAPIQADVTAAFIIAKRLLVGVMFRSGDAVGGLIGFDLSQQFHLGYSYDFSYGLETPKYNSGSHELMLRYDFRFASKKQIHSPRYF